MRRIPRGTDHQRAEPVTEELRSLASKKDYIHLGKRLHEVYGSDLWRERADSWKDYIADIGLSGPMDFQYRKNYVVFILELGLDPADHRLSQAPPSKLFVGTRTKFKRWVSDNLDAFLECARLPPGEGGLTREELYKHLEHQVGANVEDSEDRLAKKSLRAFRHAVDVYRELPEEAWSAFIDGLWQNLDLRDEMADLRDAMTEALAAVDEWDQDIEVSLDD